MEEDETQNYQCHDCGGRIFFENGGSYYCRHCLTMAQGIILTATDDDGKTAGGGAGGVTRHRRHTPSEGTKEVPRYEDCCNEVRNRYVEGIQWTIQLQCEALVAKFGVSPLICGVASAVWLRFVVAAGVFKDVWADNSFTESENQLGEFDDSKIHDKGRDELHKENGQHVAMVWFRSLRKVIPLDCSLAICFLACHVAREAILPTDIVKWSIEGKIPYFAAHVEIEKRFGMPSLACPISSALMFRPCKSIPLQKLERMAASIAESIGLNLPPVNFHAVACCYLNRLSVPSEKILPHACRIYEWSMPPGLWLSTNELRLPSRVSVMSILIVAIRILYNINGFGAWERSLSKGALSGVRGDGGKDNGYPLDEVADSSENLVKNEKDVQISEFDSEELLRNLEAKYSEIEEPCEFAKDLTSYLQYCKDVVFAGVGSSLRKAQWKQEEEELIDKLWDFYQNAEDYEPVEEVAGKQGRTSDKKRSRSDDASFVPIQPTTRQFREMFHESPLQDSDNSDPAKQTAITKLKLDMEENRFSYIPPRVNIKRSGYLQYSRKQDEGVLRYVAHADYYILLRSCARVAQVDIRIMHIGVLDLERRLAWLEKRIDHSLHLTTPSITCDFCRNVTECEYDVVDRTPESRTLPLRP